MDIVKKYKKQYFKTAKDRNKCTCEFGGHLSYGCKTMHMKTNKHQTFLKLSIMTIMNENGLSTSIKYIRILDLKVQDRLYRVAQIIPLI